MEIITKTHKGGHVVFNDTYDVRAGYSAFEDEDDILYARAELDDGRMVQFSLDRKNGLVTVKVGTENLFTTNLKRL